MQLKMKLSQHLHCGQSVPDVLTCKKVVIWQTDVYYMSAQWHLRLKCFN